MSKTVPQNTSLIPRPLKQESREGIFESRGVPAIAKGSPFDGEIAVFSAQMAARYGSSEKNEKDANIFCKLNEGISAEGYHLKITAEKIELAAATGAGMHNGLQSLRQLFLSGDTGDIFEKNIEKNAASRFVIPCTEIEDAPRYSWRGFMLDCSRFFYPVSFIKKMLDVLSLHHINVFHWHLTDDHGWRLPVPEYPLLVEIGSKRRNPCRQEEIYIEGFYTEAEISEVVAYAAARHITVVPEVDLPGHTLSALTAYPDLGCTGGPYQVEWRFGVFDDILCAGNDRIFEFAAAIFDTLERLFPGKYVHIGGDEAPTARWEACPRCRSRITELQLAEPRQLQRWLTRRFAEMLSQRGKTAIGWDEVLEGTEGNKYTALPDNLAVMFWRSWMDKQPVVDAAASGRRIIMTPASHGAYLSMKQTDEPGEPGSGDEASTLRNSYTIPMTYPGMTGKSDRSVIGGQASIWGEYINSCPNAEYMIFPRLCALAEVFWLPEERKCFDDFSQRLPVHQKRLDALGVLQHRG